jgi:uncharacterized repeat protein (TIGR03803 family)
MLIVARNCFKFGWTVGLVAVALIVISSSTASSQTFESFSPIGPSPNAGRYPSAGVILASDGNFYGTTYEGGEFGVGAIFRMTPAGDITLIHSFDDANGSHPYAELIEWRVADGGDGNLYGTTNDQATSASGVGTVFTVTKQGTGFTVLHSLPLIDPIQGCFPEGAGILAPLVRGANGLYGVVASGGCTNSNAAFFRISPLTGPNRFSIIGHIPDTGTTSGLTRGTDDLFYGTTEGTAGLGFGVIYRIGESGGNGQVLKVLTRQDGYAHTGEMIQPKSELKFYGTARAGGEYSCNPPASCDAAFEGGTVFQFVPGADEANSTYTRIYSFAENDPAGSEPYTGLVKGNDGLLYGTTIRTGANRTSVGADQGAIFSVSPTTFGVNPLYTFGNDPSGAGSPRGPLVELSPGAFIGTTYHGGFSGFGVVFRFTLANATTTALTAAPNATVFGQQVTLTATISSSGNPSGNVEFLDGKTSLGTAPVSGGTATLNTTGLNVGTHTLSATYVGDGTFLPSTSPNASVTVSRANTTTTLDSLPNPSSRKQIVTVTATITADAPGAGTATGQVQFLEGKKKVGTVLLVNGVARLQITFNNMGSHDLTATYAGDGNFVGSTSAVHTHVVNR